MKRNAFIFTLASALIASNCFYIFYYNTVLRPDSIEVQKKLELAEEELELAEDEYFASILSIPSFSTDNSVDGAVTATELDAGIVRYATWINAVHKRINKALCDSGLPPVNPRSPVAWTIDAKRLSGTTESDSCRLYIMMKAPHTGSELPKLSLVAVPVVRGRDQEENIVNLIEPCPEACDKESRFWKAYKENLRDDHTCGN